MVAVERRVPEHQVLEALIVAGPPRGLLAHRFAPRLRGIAIERRTGRFSPLEQVGSGHAFIVDVAHRIPKAHHAALRVSRRGKPGRQGFDLMLRQAVFRAAPLAEQAFRLEAAIAWILDQTVLHPVGGVATGVHGAVHQRQQVGRNERIGRVEQHARGAASGLCPGMSKNGSPTT